MPRLVQIFRRAFAVIGCLRMLLVLNVWFLRHLNRGSTFSSEPRTYVALWFGNFSTLFARQNFLSRSSKEEERATKFYYARKGSSAMPIGTRIRTVFTYTCMVLVP